MLGFAEVVEWQTRSFQVRVPQGVRVRIPPSVQQIKKAQMVDNQLFALYFFWKKIGFVIVYMLTIFYMILIT